MAISVDTTMAAKLDRTGNRQRELKPCDERVRGLASSQASTVGKRSRTQLTICLAVIAPDMRATS